MMAGKRRMLDRSKLEGQLLDQIPDSVMPTPSSHPFRHKHCMAVKPASIGLARPHYAARNWREGPVLAA